MRKRVDERLARHLRSHGKERVLEPGVLEQRVVAVVRARAAPPVLEHVDHLSARDPVHGHSFVPVLDDRHKLAAHPQVAVQRRGNLFQAQRRQALLAALVGQGGVEKNVDHERTSSSWMKFSRKERLTPKPAQARM